MRDIIELLIDIMILYRLTRRGLVALYLRECEMDTENVWMELAKFNVMHHFPQSSVQEATQLLQGWSLADDMEVRVYITCLYNCYKQTYSYSR